MSHRSEAFDLAEAGNIDGLRKWTRDMNESGLRKEATAILRELVAIDMHDVVKQLDAVWSPDVDAYAYATGEVDVPRCVLCQAQPCACPPFGSPEYFDLVKQRHA